MVLRQPRLTPYSHDHLCEGCGSSAQKMLCSRCDAAPSGASRWSMSLPPTNLSNTRTAGERESSTSARPEKVPEDQRLPPWTRRAKRFSVYEVSAESRFISLPVKRGELCKHGNILNRLCSPLSETAIINSRDITEGKAQWDTLRMLAFSAAVRLKACSNVLGTRGPGRCSHGIPSHKTNRPI